MYNFRITNHQKETILKECNLNEIEEFIFNNLVKGKTRMEVYDLVKQKYNKSSSTTNRTIKKIRELIKNFENDTTFTYKVYIHRFPNGKKYVGVCQNCISRWSNGINYYNNKEMFLDIQKYGWDNIKHEILLTTINSNIAYEVETILIKELDLTNPKKRV